MVENIIILISAFLLWFYVNANEPIPKWMYTAGHFLERNANLCYINILASVFLFFITI